MYLIILIRTWLVIVIFTESRNDEILYDMLLVTTYELDSKDVPGFSVI